MSAEHWIIIGVCGVGLAFSLYMIRKTNEEIMRAIEAVERRSKDGEKHTE